MRYNQHPLRVLLRFAEVEFYLRLHFTFGSTVSLRCLRMIQRSLHGTSFKSSHRTQRATTTGAGSWCTAMPPATGHSLATAMGTAAIRRTACALTSLHHRYRPSIGPVRASLPTRGQILLCRGAEALSEADRRALRRPKCKVGMTGLYNCVFMAGCGLTLDNHQDLLDKAGSSGRALPLGRSDPATRGLRLPPAPPTTTIPGSKRRGRSPSLALCVVL